MPTIITEETIKGWVENGVNIESGAASCAEGIKYDFRLGSKFLKSHFGRIVDFNLLSSEEKRHAIIKPGEVVYVLTEERLNLANDIFVQLSPKRKLSHAGVMLLGGLTIDPGYKGNLIFGLCNLSSTDFTLDPGRKLVGAVFYRLAADEIVAYEVPEALNEFPEAIVNIIKQYTPVETLRLSEEIKRLSDENARFSRALESDNEWKSTFKQNLGTVTEKLEKVSDKLTEISFSLKTEIEMRQNGEDTLKKSDENLKTAVEGIDKNISSMKIWAKVLATIFSLLGAIGVGFIVAYFSVFFARDSHNNPEQPRPAPAITTPAPPPAEIPQRH